MSTDESARLIERIRPELAVLTHFGLKLLKQDPKGEAEWVESLTGIRTVAAWDGMSIHMGNRLTVK
jgi:hypothetical protein